VDNLGAGAEQAAMSQVAANAEDNRATAKAIVEKYWSGDARDRYLIDGLHGAKRLAALLPLAVGSADV
jgi:hypothetical protein